MDPGKPLDSPSRASFLRASGPLPLVSSNTFILFHYYYSHHHHHHYLGFVWIAVPFLFLFCFVFIYVFPILSPTVIFPLASRKKDRLGCRTSHTRKVFFPGIRSTMAENKRRPGRHGALTGTSLSPRSGSSARAGAGATLQGERPSQHLDPGWGSKQARCPDQCGSVGWTLSRGAKGGLGHCGQGTGLGRGSMERVRGNGSVFLSHICVSLLPLFPSHKTLTHTHTNTLGNSRNYLTLFHRR